MVFKKPTMNTGIRIIMRSIRPLAEMREIALESIAQKDVITLEQEPLPTYETIQIQTQDIRERFDLSTEHGTYFEKKVLYSDGTKRTEYIGLAKKPTSDIPVYKKPAWFTAPDKGFNKLANDSMHKIGRHTITGGIATNKAHSLYRNAWDNHLSLDETGLQFYQIDTSVIDCEGDSNGAMEATALMAYGQHFNRTVNKAYLVDPCLVHKIASYDVSKFFKHPDYIPREIFNLAKHVVYLLKEEGDIIEYAKTLQPSKEFIIGNLLLSRALFWGEFGHVLAHIPENQTAHYRLYEYSIANQKKDFFSILRSDTKNLRRNVSAEVLPGTHISIASPDNLDKKVQYLK